MPAATARRASWESQPQRTDTSPFWYNPCSAKEWWWWQQAQTTRFALLTKVTCTAAGIMPRGSWDLETNAVSQFGRMSLLSRARELSKFLQEETTLGQSWVLFELSRWIRSKHSRLSASLPHQTQYLSQFVQQGRSQVRNRANYSNEH